jgi:uncharacterized protein YjiS (DUF1127 family)
MSAVSLHRSHAGSVLAKAGALVRACGRVVSGILHEIEIRRAMRDLRELGDHQLRDIGVTPSDVEHLVRNGRDRLGRVCRPSKPERF